MEYKEKFPDMFDVTDKESWKSKNIRKENNALLV